jgi:hypothetical protein
MTIVFNTCNSDKQKQNAIQQTTTYDSWEHMVIWKLVGLYQIELSMAFLTRKYEHQFYNSNNVRVASNKEW